MKRPSRNSFRTIFARRARPSLTVCAAFAGFLCACPPPVARAVVYTWSAGGSGNDVFTAANWLDGTAPTNDGNAELVFTDVYLPRDNINVTPTISADLYLNALTFAGGRNFTLGSAGGGYRVYLGGGGHTQASAVSQTITAATFLTDAQTWSFSNLAGSLNFTGNGLVNTQGYALTVQTPGTTSLSGVISGSGGLTKRAPAN